MIITNIIIIRRIGLKKSIIQIITSEKKERKKSL